jgi:tetratricopeptide (TPR) repeat protein
MSPFLLAFPLVLALSPRITFDRILPPPHDLGKAEEIALVHAIGDTAAIDAFVDNFVDQVNHSGVLRMRDARRATGPADAYLAVKSFTCQTFPREGEGTAHDQDGNKIKRKQFWIDAICTARVEVMAADMKRVSAFASRGEGMSPRVETITDEEKDIAVSQAAHYAAVDAAAHITPRRVREVIPLDDTAPAFGEGMSLIDAGRLEDARARWEAALKTQPRNAALHFNLAAICEALGDRKAADGHYVAAHELAPKEERFAAGWRAFQRRSE